jgi:hypothetical protein
MAAPIVTLQMNWKMGISVTSLASAGEPVEDKLPDVV